MTLATNTIDSSPSLPTLAAIQRRRRELLAFQVLAADGASHRAA